MTRPSFGTHIQSSHGPSDDTDWLSIRVDPGFQSYIPALSPEEKSQLEQNIAADGCRDPLVIWNNVILDGHNRFEICTRLGLPFSVVEMQFADREAALDWMDAHQLGRRNLTADARKLLLGRRYNRMKRAPGGTGANQHREQMGHSDPAALRTAAKLAVEHGVSEATVKRAGRFAEQIEADAELKAAVETGQSVASVKRARAENVPPPPAPKPPETEDDKERREVARLSTDGMIDEIIGLRACLADERKQARALSRERDGLKAQLRDHTADDKDEVIRRLSKRLRDAENARWRAEEKTSGFIRENYVLKKRVKELEQMPVAMG